MPFDVRKSSAFPASFQRFRGSAAASGPMITDLDNGYRAEDGGRAAWKVGRAAGEAQLRRTSAGKARKASFDTAPKRTWLGEDSFGLTHSLELAKIGISLCGELGRLATTIKIAKKLRVLTEYFL